MRRAWLNLRYEKQPMFGDGLRRLGFAIENGLTFDPCDGDILVTWNRIHAGDHAAKIFEARGLAVLVTENASWGNEFAGEKWYTLAGGYHNVTTGFPQGGGDRWDELGVRLEPWRADGGETVILASRSIGPPRHRMPAGWAERIRAQQAPGIACRIRPHPGKEHHRDRGSLAQDLGRCGRVVTWGSGAAIKALMWGIKVESHMPNWIGEQDNSDAGRLAMFRRLAWAQARHSEIASGEAFARLLD